MFPHKLWFAFEVIATGQFAKTTSSSVENVGAASFGKDNDQDDKGEACKTKNQDYELWSSKGSKSYQITIATPR